MIVMGIDCASKLTGIAILDGKKLLYREQYNTGLPPNADDKELSKALNLFKKNIKTLSKKYKVKKIVPEFTGMTRNATTFRLLCYFETACMMAAVESNIKIERARTITARKEVTGSGKIDKQIVVKKIIKKYGKMSEDEAEAILFALYGSRLML
jgi:Holliday junction resolvasome RuvABC endonuclease subunit